MNALDITPKPPNTPTGTIGGQTVVHEVLSSSSNPLPDEDPLPVSVSEIDCGDGSASSFTSSQISVSRTSNGLVYTTTYTHLVCGITCNFPTPTPVPINGYDMSAPFGGIAFFASPENSSATFSTTLDPTDNTAYHSSGDHHFSFLEIEFQNPASIGSFYLSNISHEIYDSTSTRDTGARSVYLWYTKQDGSTGYITNPDASTLETLVTNSGTTTTTPITFPTVNNVVKIQVLIRDANPSSDELTIALDEINLFDSDTGNSLLN